jgi:metal-responsive CopG/Arc/MetJ family transcriptional regulator
MKTAVSIPDELFEAAEKQAAKENTSRSHLYATALAEYLRRERGMAITKEMNLALEEIDQTPDPAWEAVQIAALKRSEWK